jgi:hypothetical protein
MEIVVIGTDPPCPRCKETYERAKRVCQETGRGISIRKIVYTSEEAQRLGRLGTAHEIAQWAGIKMAWDKVRELASGEWTHELDDLLMPLKEKAEQENWIMTPVVVIDGEIAHFGYVPDLNKIRRMLNPP